MLTQCLQSGYAEGSEASRDSRQGRGMCVACEREEGRLSQVGTLWPESCLLLRWPGLAPQLWHAPAVMQGYSDCCADIQLWLSPV
jgi:hypothetical protein